MRETVIGDEVGKRPLQPLDEEKLGVRRRHDAREKARGSQRLLAFVETHPNELGAAVVLFFLQGLVGWILLLCGAGMAGFGLFFLVRGIRGQYLID